VVEDKETRLFDNFSIYFEIDCALSIESSGKSELDASLSLMSKFVESVVGREGKSSTPERRVERRVAIYELSERI
jgi:hypothetical protein